LYAGADAGILSKRKSIIQPTFYLKKNYQNDILLYIKNNKNIKYKIIDNKTMKKIFPRNFIFLKYLYIFLLITVLNIFFSMKVIKLLRKSQKLNLRDHINKKLM
jgi:hypothetical protein